MFKEYEIPKYVWKCDMKGGVEGPAVGLKNKVEKLLLRVKRHKTIKMIVMVIRGIKC